MIVYFIMYGLILLATPVIARTGKTAEQQRRRAALWMIVLIVLVVGLRHPSMGVDLQYRRPYGYLWSFEAIAQFPLSDILKGIRFLNYEWGYVLFNKLLSFVSLDESWLLFAAAVCSYIPVGLLIARHSRDPVLSTVVYLGLPCFLLPFSGLRQGIAIGVCCLAAQYIQRKKILSFVLAVLAANLFHHTAFIFLAAYPLYRIRFFTKNRVLSLLVLAAVFIARRPLFEAASRLFQDDARVDDNGAVTLLIVFVLVYVFCIVFLKERDESSAGFLNVFYFACICQCFGGLYSTAIRVGYYFMPALAAALPNIIAGMDDPRSYSLSRKFVMAAFAAYGLYALYSGGHSWAMTYPYHFFWSGALS